MASIDRENPEFMKEIQRRDREEEARRMEHKYGPSNIQRVLAIGPRPLTGYSGTHTVMRGELKTGDDIKRFIFAGNATFTVRSRSTGERFTFNLKRPRGNRNDKPVFASVLTGQDNTNDYRYLCTVWPGRGWTINDNRSTVTSTAPSARAFRWIIGMVATGRARVLTEKAEFFHEGSCGRCGRKLTVPESIESGIGPECAKKVQITVALWG